MPLRMWHAYWLLWIGVGFVVPETIALITGKGTLSDTIWRWFGVKDGISITHWTVLHFFLLAFMVWLFGHMVFRLWR